MKIAITGGRGFIGEELIDELLKTEETEITVLTREELSKENKEISSDETYNRRISLVNTDYSQESLERVLCGIDIVIHLAAVRGTSTCREDYVVNEELTEKILKAMKVCSVKRIVFASTISVYDDVDTIPWKENSPLKARTMYGDSKIACEKLINEYAEENGFDYSIIRIAQVLGLGEKRRGMMNVFLDTAEAGGQIKVIGKSKAKRQYVYIKDLVKIISSLATRNGDGLREDGSETINVGMPNAYTNLEIAQIVNEVYENLTPIEYDDSTAETIKASEMDIAYLEELLRYVPRDMKESIEDIKMRKH